MDALATLSALATITTLGTPFVALVLLGLAAIRFGHDSRDPMTDDHRR